MMTTYLIVGAVIVVILLVAKFSNADELEYVSGAYWLTGFERWRLLSRFKKGFVVDGHRSRLSLEDSYKHLLICSQTGGGKTTRLVLPNLLNANGVSFIVNDPDASAWKLSAGWLSSEGYAVWKIDVADQNNSLKYNPLARVKTHREASMVSSTLLHGAFPERGGGDRFWTDSAEALLTTLIMILKQCEEKYQHLGALKRLLNQFGPGSNGLDEWVSTHADPALFSNFMGFRQSSEKVAASIVSTVQTALRSWSDDQVCQLTATDNVDFSALRTRKTALFFCVPELESRNWSVVGALLFSQLFAFAMQTPKEGDLPILVLLDELGVSAPIPDFAKIVATSRRRRLGILTSIQDKAQLERIYGREDAHIIANGGCSTRIYLGGLAHGMCKDVSDSLGKTICIDRRDGQERRITRSLLEPDAVRMLPPGNGVILSGGHRPAMLRMKAFYEIRKLRLRSEIPPPEVMCPENKTPEYISLTTRTSYNDTGVSETEFQIPSGNGGALL